MVNQSQHFTCIGKGHGAPAIPATREDWEKMRRDPKLKEMCRRIALGHEKVKRKLPIWTPSCAEFADNHRAIKDALKPLRRLMLDFDEKGHSKEILERSLQLQEQGKWEILLVEESVRKGTHVLITLPEGMSPQEAQNRFSHDVGFQADPALKDVARCIYMVPAEYTLFVNEEKLFVPSPNVIQTTEGRKNLENIAQHQVDAPGILRRSAPLDDKIGESYPQTHEGIPYTDIIETLEEQMGGRPDIGSRNNFIFSMACHLRYICNDDPAWIAQVLPTYGEERDKFLATVKSACNRIQTKSMPRIMKRTLSVCKQQGESEADTQVPPEMPAKLPPLIELLVSRTPKIYRPAVASAVFPALGAHLWQTTFRYIDNCLHEATLSTLLLAPTGSGKSCVNMPIDYIMADIRERDRLSMEKERKWKQDMQTKGANKDKKKRPEGIIIQEIDPDSTSAAFVQRMADAEGRFLYARMNEIQQLNNLSSRGNSQNVFDLLCLAFDYGNIYGQTRVGTSSVSERVCVRFNYNVSTTIRKGQQFFSRVLTDGPLSRISICTIPEREIGAEMPVYGTYGDDFAEALKPYIGHLTAARGLVECDEANRLARVLMQENADFARLSQSRVFENFSFRANVIAFLKAMVLYVAHGKVWTAEMEDFIRWSLRYDMWCKMEFFGQAIEEQEYAGEKGNRRGPQNLLDLLPVVFTREEAGMLRQRQGIRTGSLSFMLSNWKKRGYIEIYGEEMSHKEIDRQRYIKSESYLKEHPQKDWSVGQLVS
ncbi:MAG: VirE protein [Bacteroidaceae bacterium]|nr:VirE protein [Bacteroidaceae bacterium]